MNFFSLLKRAQSALKNSQKKLNKSIRMTFQNSLPSLSLRDCPIISPGSQTLQKPPLIPRRRCMHACINQSFVLVWGNTILVCWFVRVVCMATHRKMHLWKICCGVPTLCAKRVSRLATSYQCWYCNEYLTTVSKYSRLYLVYLPTICEWCHPGVLNMTRLSLFSWQWLRFPLNSYISW